MFPRAALIAVAAAAAIGCAAPSRPLLPAIATSPATMEAESAAAFASQQARFSAIADAALRDAIAWHAQARIVDERFNLQQQRPGHHAVSVGVFGGHVSWGIPSLVVSRRARDERAPRHLAHGAGAIATLEQVVGWPSLEAALQVVATANGPLDRAAVQALLEAALGIPVGWALDALDPDVRVNYAVAGVESAAHTCGGEPCHRTSITLARHGTALFGGPSRSGALTIVIAMEFPNAAASRLTWDGVEASKTLVVESGLAPSAVTLDPDRVIVLDDNWHDQRWHAEPAAARRPIKTMAAWMVWLQNAALTYGLLL